MIAWRDSQVIERYRSMDELDLTLRDFKEFLRELARSILIEKFLRKPVSSGEGLDHG
jgi:hypothetical protein